MITSQSFVFSWSSGSIFFISFTYPFTRQEIAVYLASTKLMAVRVLRVLPSSYVLSEVLGTLFLFFSISVMERWVLSQTLGQLSSLCRDYIDCKKNWLSNKSSAQSILRDDSFHPTIHVTSDKSSGLSHSMNLVSQYMYHLLSNTWIILKPWSMENWTTYYVSPWSWSLL